MNAESMLFSSLVNGGVIENLRHVNRNFLSPDWIKIFDFISAFIQKEGKLPRAQTIEGEFGVVLPPAPEDISYYLSAIHNNAMRVRLEDGLTQNVIPPLKESKPADAITEITKVVTGINAEFRSLDRGLVLDDMPITVQARIADYYLRKRSRDCLGLPTPWPTITRCTGGFLPGDAWAIVGRPNVGKTWFLVVMAVHLWQLGYRVLFASMETPPQSLLPKSPYHRVVRGLCSRCFSPADPSQICPAATIPRQRLTNRFDAIGARVSAWRQLHGLLTPLEEQRLMQYYQCCTNAAQLGWGQLRIVAAPIVKSIAELEIEILAFQPDVVFWDSAYRAVDFYISQGIDSRTSYSKLLWDYKALLERTAVPGVISWHFSRDVAEGAEGATQNEIAHTDEMGKVLDVILGVFQPPELKLVGEAIWESLKVRDGLRMSPLKTKYDVKNEIAFAEIGVKGESEQKRS